MQTNTLPGRSKRGRSRTASCLFVLLLALIVFFMVAGGFVLFASAQPRPTTPIVEITDPPSGSQVLFGKPVVVYALARDPDKIAKVDFMVNGQLVGTQLSQGAQQAIQFSSSQAWRPAKIGAYVVTARATNTRGYSGDSQPLLVEAVEKLAEPDAGGQYVVQPGDTLDTIAKDLGVTPKDVVADNPALATRPPADGESLAAPHAPEGPSDDPPAGSPGSIPSVEPPPAPPPGPPGAPGPSGPLPPPDDPWWRRLGILGPPRLCNLLSGILDCPSIPRAGGRPPNGPRSISAVLDGCAIVVRWSDDSDNETGFRVLRHRPRGPVGELVAIIAPNGTSYEDHPGGGRFDYFVVAFNAEGVSFSGVTTPIEVPDTCHVVAGGVITNYEFEALEMTLSGSFDRIYCYASLGSAPYERVPSSPSMFLRLESGRTDIAEYLGGRNKRYLALVPSIPLQVNADCLGRRGADLVDLGRIDRSHPSTEWDGRSLTASTGTMSITYRIRRVTELGETPSTDIAILPPFNLRRADSYQTCSSDGFCDDHVGGSLAWDWHPASGDRHHLVGFKVYRLSTSDAAPHLFQTVNYYTRSVQLLDCDERALYTVVAVMLERVPGGGQVESPRSDGFEMVVPCRAVMRFTLRTLGNIRVDDGCDFSLLPIPHCDADHTAEAYGEFKIEVTDDGAHYETIDIDWNQSRTHGIPGASSRPEGSIRPPRDVAVAQGRGYSWSRMVLSIIGFRRMDFRDGRWISPGGYRRNNNIVDFPVELRSGNVVRVSWIFKDWDELTDDEVWCQSDGNTIPLPNSMEGLYGFSQDFSTDGRGPYGSCTVLYRLEGIRP